jgi:hypothetical protein
MYTFFTLALDGGDWSASRPAHSTYEERAYGYNSIGGWVGPRAPLVFLKRGKLPYPVDNRTTIPLLSDNSLITIPTELTSPLKASRV